MSVQAFYDELAPLYHLVYENLEASVVRMTNAVSMELTTAAAATPMPTGSQRRSGAFRCRPRRAG